jgi:enoyl-CoA hydratase/carnithine racemase
MSEFSIYRNSFQHAKLDRKENGVLEVALHSSGKTLVFDAATHEEFVELFYQIGRDEDTRVVILTGVGDAFIDNIDGSKFDFRSAKGFHKMYREGQRVLANLIDSRVPVIAAVNGPATVHSEYVLLSDIVLATPETVFQDKPHPSFGIVPGDGIHSIWPHVIGSIRGRYFVLTGQRLSAEDAKLFGAVNEIAPRVRLLSRAHEIAAAIAAQPPITSRLSRVAVTQPLRRLLEESLSHGLALEGLSAALTTSGA